MIKRGQTHALSAGLALFGLVAGIFLSLYTSTINLQSNWVAFAQEEESEHRRRIAELVAQFHENPSLTNLKSMYGQEFNAIRLRGKATPHVISENGNRLVARDDIHIFSVPDEKSLEAAVEAAERLRAEYESDMTRQTGKRPIQTFLAVHSDQNDAYNRRLYKFEGGAPAAPLRADQFRPFAGFHEIVNNAGGVEEAMKIYKKSTLDYFMGVEATLAKFGNFDSYAVAARLTLVEKLKLARASNDQTEVERLQSLIRQGYKTEEDLLKTKEDLQREKKERGRTRFLIISRGTAVGIASGVSSVGVYLVSGGNEFAYLALAGLIALFQGGLSSGLQAINKGINRWYEYDGWMPPLSKSQSEEMASRNRAGFGQSVAKQAIVTTLILGGLTAVADATGVDSFINREIVWSNLETWLKMGVTGGLSLAGKIFYRRKFGLESWRADQLKLINHRAANNEQVMGKMFFRNDLAAVLLSVAITTPEMLRQTGVAPTAGLVALLAVGAGGAIHYIFEDVVDKFLENMYAAIGKTTKFLRTKANALKERMKSLPGELKNRLALEIAARNTLDETSIHRLREEMNGIRRQLEIYESELAEITGLQRFAAGVTGGFGRELGTAGAPRLEVISATNRQRTQRRAGGGGCRVFSM